MHHDPAPPPAAPDARRSTAGPPALSTRLGLAVSVWFMSVVAALVTAALLVGIMLLLVNAYYGTNDDRAVLATVIFFGLACGAGGRLLLAMCASHVTSESRGHISASPMVVGCALGYGAVVVLMQAWPPFRLLSWFALLLQMAFAAMGTYIPWRGTGTNVFWAVAIVGGLVTAYGSLAG